MEEVGRYQVDQMVGEGAMARVYKAYDPKIDRTLAIKLLKSHLLTDEEYRVRFFREAKGAGILSHPNIVTVFDVGEEDNHPFLAMEWVEGTTLADVLKQGRKFSAKEVVEIGIQLARALDYAHRKGIVHRDVKPGNIMLVKDSLTVKVADFGICRISEADTQVQAQHTQMGDVLGTPHYMSPEQVLGEKVDSRSDLFSAGVVLYQLLTGALPFDGDSLISVAFKITKSDPPSIDKLRPDLPLALRRVIDRALKKQPDKRYQTWRGFRAGADRRGEGVGRRGAQEGLRSGHLAVGALGADDGGAGRGHDDAHRGAPVSAPVLGDAGPGQELRRLARETGRDRNGGAAPVRGLGGDRRLHPGNDVAAEFQPSARDRLPGHRSRRQRPGAGQRQVQAAGVEAAVVARSRHRGAERTARRRAHGARFHGAGPVPGRRRSARCASASTKRRSPKSRILC